MQTKHLKPSRQLWKSVLLAGFFLLLGLPSFSQARVIEIVADKDSTFKIAGQRNPQITAKAGEQLILRITARKGQSWSRDGSVHGFTLVRKDRSLVSGWNLPLKPGTQEFSLTVPAEPGDYEVLCSVLCSEKHESMNMKFVVVP